MEVTAKKKRKPTVRDLRVEIAEAEVWAAWAAANIEKLRTEKRGE